jgi:hypothetical protein
MIAVSSSGTANRIPTQRTSGKVGVGLNKRGKLWAKIIGVFVIFLVGVGIGHSQGVKDGQGQIPATVQAQLVWCQAHSKTPCHAEYVLHTPSKPGAAAKVGDTGPAGWDVIADGDATVADFNDGFATSKQDDCQQGDAKACAWLKVKH